MAVRQQDWRVQNRYDLQTDLYTIAGIGAIGELANRHYKGVTEILGKINDGVTSFTRSIIIEPITRVSEDINKLYMHKSDLDYEKEIASYNFMEGSDKRVYEAEKDKLIILIVAVCFLLVFVLNS